MTISPEAVQAALDAWDCKLYGNDWQKGGYNDERGRLMQAALAAAFPIMLRDCMKEAALPDAVFTAKYGKDKQ
jgi:hypothetical protein